MRQLGKIPLFDKRTGICYHMWDFSGTSTLYRVDAYTEDQAVFSLRPVPNAMRDMLFAGGAASWGLQSAVLEGLACKA